MPPQTRSRGVPPPSRVYHSTPGEQQVHFPPRRRVVRTYGKQTRKKDNVVPARSLRQQTLTQIDFVSSFEEEREPVILSDSDDDADADDDNVQVDENKENKENGNAQNNEQNDEDDEPVSSGRKRRANSRKTTTKNDRSKRRRTLGDDSDTEQKGQEKKETRRRTLGDLPTSSYHTQTLTQFLGRDPAHALCIKDSEDEDEEQEGEDEGGFQDWLLDPASPSPLRRKQASSSPATARRLRFASPKGKGKQVVIESPTAEREESIVPQTPAKQTPVKRPVVKQTTRDEVPSSSQLSALSTPSMPTPVERMIDRYGPPDKAGTPLKKKSSPAAGSGPRSILKGLPGKPRRSMTPRPRKEVVIQDSFATDSWDKDELTPLRSQNLGSPSVNRMESAETSSALDEMETPTKPRRRGESTELGKTASPTPRKLFSPRKGKRVVLDEIPDSDEDDEDFDVFDENQDDGEYVAGPETQLVMSEIASTEEEESVKSKATTPPVLAPSSEVTTLPPRSSSPLRSRPNRRRVRKPLHEPALHATTQTQPLESQRVAPATLQSLPFPSARTDIILPLDQDTLSAVVEGFQAHITLPFKIPAQVVRFWLFDGELLQYMACADPGRIDGSSTWRYTLPQVYELNNPMNSDDMREEEWISGDVTRYAYFPPAVVGQLMWNLRHALFKEVDAHPLDQEVVDDEEEEDEQVQLLPSSSQHKGKNPTPTPSISISQQVEAQLQSDIAQSTSFPTSDDILVPSTPEAENKRQKTLSASASSTPTKLTPRKSSISTFKRPSSRLPPLTGFTPSSYRASRPPLNTIRPSQATTASQASTPEKSSAASHRHPSHPQLHSSSSLVFNDHSPLQLPTDLAAGNGASGGLESQLLTKSQTLPDSLLHDDARLPPEIWDSEDDDDAHL
ncbi:hypothetical protein B0T10DRAFT_489992 [Thelonectria olida]|uniref:Uncharacterized protein n=1 Tax=Thelonectria olida TaxID=1576542 RepID=A0A9P9AKN6_9HYPO|nr:hypothetical protein B0T10DRAFT_489992 [Thelonectria olida]